MKRIWNALLVSLAGLRSAWKGEAAFRQEVFLAAILLPAAWVIAQDDREFALLALPVFIVLIAELINTAIEAAVDHTSENEHPLAKKAKDAASAAVFLSLALLAAVWSVMLF